MGVPEKSYSGRRCLFIKQGEMALKCRGTRRLFVFFVRICKLPFPNFHPFSAFYLLTVAVSSCSAEDHVPASIQPYQ